MLGRRIAGVVVACSLIAGAGDAAAAVKTVDFDDLAPTRTLSNGQVVKNEITDQYKASHGVFWVDDPGYPPVVDVTSQARSGNQVANTVDGCYACEFVSGFTRGYFVNTVKSVSLYAGVIRDNYEGTSTAVVTLKAVNAEEQQLASSGPVTLTEGQPFSTKLEVSVATASIATFTLSARGGEDVGKLVAFDDLSFETPETAPPPDFSFTPGTTAVQVPQGLSRSVQMTINRVNSSNGDIDFSASNLPTGVEASFSPDPVGGDGGQTTLTLTARSDAPVGPVSDVTITATPSSGAGSDPRSEVIQVYVGANCVKQVTFLFADVRADCLRQEGEDYYVAYSQEVKVNGLLLVPSASDPLPGVKVIVDKKNRRIHTDGGVYAIALPTDPEIPLFANRLDWQLPASGDLTSIGSFDLPAAAKIGGLGLKRVEVNFSNDAKALLKPTFNLSFWPFTYVGGVAGGTSFATSNDGGVDFSGFAVSIAKIPLPGIDLKNVKLEWNGYSTWGGGATVVLKFASGRTVSAYFTLENGSFKSLNAAVANLNAPIFTGIYLQKIGVKVQKDPLRLRGEIGVSAGPSVAGKKAVTIDGGLSARFASPFSIQVDGEAKLGGKWKLATAYLKYTSGGLVELGGKAKWDLKVGKIEGRVNGWVYKLDAFNLEGSARGCIYVKWSPDPCASAKALISSVGIAACVEIYWVSGGIGYRWGGDFDLFSGCDLGKYRPEKPGASAAGPWGVVSVVPRSVTLPGGLPKASIALEGDGEPPQVVLIGPRGERVRVSRRQSLVRNKRFIAVAGGDNTTYIVIRRPSGGKWRIRRLAGSARITRVRKAYGLPDPSVKGEVTRAGKKRKLTWRLRRIPGQTVRFTEVGSRGATVITTTNKRRGSVKFKPARRGGRRRTVVAYIDQGGLPRGSIEIDRFRTGKTKRR